jgi:hypothetical protein
MNILDSSVDRHPAALAFVESTALRCAHRGDERADPLEPVDHDAGQITARRVVSRCGDGAALPELANEPQIYLGCPVPLASTAAHPLRAGQ